MFEQINIVANNFVRIGIKQGDIVTVALPMVPEFVFIMYALNKIGAIADCIDLRLSSEEIKNNLYKTKSKFLCVAQFSMENVLPVLDDLSLEKVIVLDGFESLKTIPRFLMRLKNKQSYNKANLITWEEFIAKKQKEFAIVSDSNKSEQVAVIVHTGGTTGESKCVLMTNLNFITMAVNHKYCLTEMDSKDTFLNFLPPFTAFSIFNGINDPLSLGMCVYLVSKFDVTEFPDLMIKYKPNHVLSGPILWDSFINSPLTQNEDLSFLKTPVCGGDVLNEELEKKIIEFFKAHGCNHGLCQGYGMTECGAATCLSTDQVYKKGSVGIPFVKNIVSVFDIDTGDELKYYQSGEICMSATTIMKGYLNNQNATDEIVKVHKDGKVWLHTGDIGYMDEDGNVFVTGRMKRMIVRSGNKLFPSVIENCIASHESILNCSVVQMDNDSERHVPVAYIVVNDEINISKICSEVDEIIRQKMSECNVPYRYIVKKDFPITAANKVDYRTLEIEAKNYVDSTERVIISK